MTTRKKAQPKDKPRLKKGQQVEYHGEQYRIVQLFGPDDRYVMIENEDHRFSITAEILTRKAVK